MGGAVCAAEDEPQEPKQSKGSLFIGTEIGYGAAFLSTDNGTTTTSDFRVPYGVVGAKFGFIDYFGGNVGLRGYTSYHYSSDGEYYTHQAAFNTEVIWKLGRKFGIYAGLGVGYAHNAALSSSNVNGAQQNQTTVITDPKGSGFVVPANIGFEIRVGQDYHHTVSVNLRATTIAASERLGAANNTTLYSARNLFLTLGYAYQF